MFAISAFALGIETAGDVHPVESSQAAYVSDDGRVHADLRGDINGNDRLDTEDASLILEFAEHLDTPSPEQILRGDMDGDYSLTYKDALRVLHSLSSR